MWIGGAWTAIYVARPRRGASREMTKRVIHLFIGSQQHQTRSRVVWRLSRAARRVMFTMTEVLLIGMRCRQIPCNRWNPGKDAPQLMPTIGSRQPRDALSFHACPSAPRCLSRIVGLT